MMSLVNSEGSFWRDMRYTGVPGIDNLGQIRPASWLISEAGRVRGPSIRPNLGLDGTGRRSEQGGKFVVDYQLVRGINYLNIRPLNSAPPVARPCKTRAPRHRLVRQSSPTPAGHRPARGADRAVSSDRQHVVRRSGVGHRHRPVGDQLMEHQIDFDHIDADTLATVCTLGEGGLKNLSGQIYRAVIVPSLTVIQKGALERLRAFAAAGGKSSSSVARRRWWSAGLS